MRYLSHKKSRYPIKDTSLLESESADLAVLVISFAALMLSRKGVLTPETKQVD
jgi:hypothetical protein